ncbi:uncharacterized protein LOC109285671 [Alligator mississippiensis]|uniref:uncharacterized protein LOC109285671 n=1 Tax=Alligator mississippiensis TaxID=8496 RepID=UPI002877E22E|nr:uncharacterized protein LOC109285671 [Alligator mississippiensis]
MPSAAEWQTVTARTGAARRESVPASPVRLENRYEALAILQEMEGEEETLGQEETPHSSHFKLIKRSKRTQRRRRRVLVIGDSILRGMEGPICRQDPSAREVCCLPGAKIWDVMEVIQARIKPTDYYPLVLVHVGTNDAARRTPDHLMVDYSALGGVLKEFGAQVVFSSILPVNGRGRRHENCIRETNWRLRQWCLEAGFGFLDNDPHITTRDMLSWDGLHVSPKG